ncbi:MAG TPA: c-type cytochrome [Acidobacteriaceae bacterium]|nr:c-type cytochrome [Acidobacteriaceae bacterium]
MTHKNLLFSTLLIASLLFPAACVLAQVDQPAPSSHHHEMPKPTNLQVLPKDISPQDLMMTMHNFTGELGVHCSFCHEVNSQTHHPDFASDAKPEKSAARVMIRMTHDLNANYLTRLPDRDSKAKVTCGTCHRGQAVPAEFTPAPEEHGHMPAMPKE